MDDVSLCVEIGFFKLVQAQIESEQLILQETLRIKGKLYFIAKDAAKGCLR